MRQFILGIVILGVVCGHSDLDGIAINHSRPFLGAAPKHVCAAGVAQVSVALLQVAQFFAQMSAAGIQSGLIDVEGNGRRRYVTDLFWNVTSQEAQERLAYLLHVFDRGGLNYLEQRDFYYDDLLPRTMGRIYWSTLKKFSQWIADENGQPLASSTYYFASHFNRKAVDRTLEGREFVSAYFCDQLFNTLPSAATLLRFRGAVTDAVKEVKIERNWYRLLEQGLSQMEETLSGGVHPMDYLWRRIEEQAMGRLTPPIPDRKWHLQFDTDSMSSHGVKEADIEFSFEPRFAKLIDMAPFPFVLINLRDLGDLEVRGKDILRQQFGENLVGTVRFMEEPAGAIIRVSADLQKRMLAHIALFKEITGALEED